MKETAKKVASAHSASVILTQVGQDYRAAQAIQPARHQPTRTRWGAERTGPER